MTLKMYFFRDIPIAFPQTVVVKSTGSPVEAVELGKSIKRKTDASTALCVLIIYAESTAVL